MAWHDGEHAVFALEEATRVIWAWDARGLRPAPERVLLQWALATASSGGRIPQPRLGLDTLMGLGLAHVGPDGLSFVEPSRARDEMLIFEQLWASPTVGHQVQALLGYFRQADGRAVAAWAEVDARVRRFPAWVWLQRMGLIRREDDRLIADGRLLAYLIEADTRAALTEEQLQARLELQRLRAALAEEFVVRKEKERLVQLGRDGLADGVERISTRDVAAGFDVQSFESDGTPRYIEVKSSAGAPHRFFISQNELVAAERYRQRYVLAWVGYASRLPGAGAEVAWYRDPWAMLHDPAGPWVVSASNWEVTLRV